MRLYKSLLFFSPFFQLLMFGATKNWENSLLLVPSSLLLQANSLKGPLKPEKYLPYVDIFGIL